MVGSVLPDQPCLVFDRCILVLLMIYPLEIVNALFWPWLMTLTEDPLMTLWTRRPFIVIATSFSLMILACLLTVLLAYFRRLRMRTSLVVTSPVQTLSLLLARAVRMLL